MKGAGMRAGHEMRATLADWLDLHGLTPDVCRTLLSQTPGVAPTAKDPDWFATPEETWNLVAGYMTAALPQATRIIDQTTRETRRDFSGTGRWASRAFTFQDDKNGLVLVVCQPRQRLSDLMIIAHEFGHALQLTATLQPSHPMPPLTREICATLAELLVIEQFARTTAAEAALAMQIFTGRGAALRQRAQQDLLAALEAPSTPYSLNWNYPPARVLASRAKVKLDAKDLWRIFTGTMALPELLKATG